MVPRKRLTRQAPVELWAPQPVRDIAEERRLGAVEGARRVLVSGRVISALVIPGQRDVAPRGCAAVQQLGTDDWFATGQTAPEVGSRHRVRRQQRGHGLCPPERTAWSCGRSAGLPVPGPAKRLGEHRPPQGTIPCRGGGWPLIGSGPWRLPSRARSRSSQRLTRQSRAPGTSCSPVVPGSTHDPTCRSCHPGCR